MTVSLRKHPTEPRTYSHPDTGALLVVTDRNVGFWASEEIWLAGAAAEWFVPTLKAARERLAGDLNPAPDEEEPADGEPLEFTLRVQVTARSNDRSTLARVLELVSEAALQDPTVKIVEVTT